MMRLILIKMEQAVSQKRLLNLSRRAWWTLFGLVGFSIGLIGCGMSPTPVGIPGFDPNFMFVVPDFSDLEMPGGGTGLGSGSGFDGGVGSPLGDGSSLTGGFTGGGASPGNLRALFPPLASLDEATIVVSVPFPFGSAGSAGDSGEGSGALGGDLSMEPALTFEECEAMRAEIQADIDLTVIEIENHRSSISAYSDTLISCQQGGFSFCGAIQMTIDQLREQIEQVSMRQRRLNEELAALNCEGLASELFQAVHRSVLTAGEAFEYSVAAGQSPCPDMGTRPFTGPITACAERGPGICDLQRMQIEINMEAYLSQFVAAFERLEQCWATPLADHLIANGFVRNGNLSLGVDDALNGFWPDEAISNFLNQSLPMAAESNEGSVSVLFQASLPLKGLVYNSAAQLALSIPPELLPSGRTILRDGRDLERMTDAWLDFAAMWGGSLGATLPSVTCDNLASEAAEFYRPGQGPMQRDPGPDCSPNRMP